MEMKNYTSKTLKRTFDTVVFSSGLGEQGRTGKFLPMGPWPIVWGRPPNARHGHGQGEAARETGSGAMGWVQLGPRLARGA